MINTYTFNTTIISLFYDKLYIYEFIDILDIDYLDIISTDTILKSLQSIPVQPYHSYMLP